MKIFIKTSEIIHCWETEDACIVEMKNGKKWVCKKFFEADYGNIWNTFVYIQGHQNYNFITLELLEKGKSE